MRSKELAAIKTFQPIDQFQKDRTKRKEWNSANKRERTALLTSDVAVVESQLMEQWNLKTTLSKFQGSRSTTSEWVAAKAMAIPVTRKIKKRNDVILL
jgi:hypothetical protein